VNEVPLKKGYSEKTLKENIEQLLKDGYPQPQALAIALEIQRKAKEEKRAARQYSTAEEKLAEINLEMLAEKMQETPVVDGSKRYTMGNIRDIAPSGKHLIYYTTDTSNEELMEDVKFWNDFMDMLEVFPDETHIENEEDQIIIVSNVREMDYDASTPAPPEDRIEGSDVNEPGSAGGPGGKIEIDEKTEASLKAKVTEHNENMRKLGKADWTKTNVGQLKAVYRRGAGAYSTSHRPGVSRAAWAMARVNAYLYLLKNGRPQSKKYVTDNDLLPKDHPKSTRSR
jgi:hypothetical protein